MIFFDSVIFILALLVLFYSGDVMVRSLILVGRYLNINEYTLSFILAAFATSLPEFFVGIASIVNDTPKLSAGNIIGANVFNATLVLGMAVMVAGKLSFDRIIKKEDIQITFGLLLLPILLLLDGNLSRYDGLVLLFFFCGYLIYLLNQERSVTPVNENAEDKPSFLVFWIGLGKFSLAASALLVSSHFLVSQSIALSQKFSLPLFFIGILVAIGTTLPEIIFGVKSILLGHRSMAFGNALGSIILNLSLILGMVVSARPFTVTDPSRAFLGLFLTAGLIVLIQLVRFTKGYISRPWGVGLILIAAAFIFIESQI